MRIALILTLALALPTCAEAAVPQLRLVGERPVHVTGTGFHGAEQVTVRVSLSSGATFARTAVATRSGRIAIRFLGHTMSPCDGYSLTAVGDAGSRVTKKIAVPPSCGVVVPP